MTTRRPSSVQIKCALRFDGYRYQQQHPDYQMADALQAYWETGGWQHLSTAEAMATLFLLLKALEAWQGASYRTATHLETYYDAFHSLFDLLKDRPLPEDED